MSFHIPITFDDSPFFDWGESRRPQGRRNVSNFQSRRQPSLFEQWEDSFYDYPRRRQHYRPNYGGPTGREYENKSKFSEEDRFSDEEGTQDDTYEHRGVGQFSRDNLGWDGWDIPVQYMDRGTRPHHKHKHKQRQKPSKARDDTSNDVSEKHEPKSEQKQAKESTLNKELAKDVDATKVKQEELLEKKQEEYNMAQQSNKHPNTKMSSETSGASSEKLETTSCTAEPESENVEIPIAYSPPKNTRRRLSKRLSQCDPPSPADIKLTRIKSIVQKTEGIEEKIAEFVDSTQNKNYLYISETLMKILLDLDTVDSEGFDNVRQARKEGVRTVQALVEKLENKLEENKQS